MEQQQQMQNGEIKRKESLTPPPKRDVTWSEYIQSPAGQHPVLGRASKCKESSRAFKATVAMSEDFPLTVEMLLNVLEVIAPQFKHFQKLRDFIEMKLPPGFPVKVDIPVLPTVSARVTFHDFHWKNQEEKLSDELFSIPEGYVSGVPGYFVKTNFLLGWRKQKTKKIFDYFRLKVVNFIFAKYILIENLKFSRQFDMVLLW